MLGWQHSAHIFSGRQARLGLSDGDSVGDNMIMVVVVRRLRPPPGGSAGPVFPVGADVPR